MAQLPVHRSNSVYEQRSEEIIPPIDGKPTIRISRFLKPIVKDSNFVASIPKTPFLYELFHHKNIKKWPFEVNFTGWKKPHKDWCNWYNRLVVNHATTWLKAGILDGIHSSMHNVPCSKELVLGVCEFWCPKSNTFMFPWGEATITLEDVLVLGGFPVVGGSVSKAIEGDLSGIVDGLERAKGKISNKVVKHSSWMKHFMKEEEDEGEMEHVAFLALWLSRFVFPDLGESVVKNCVFPIAAHLSKGTPICIAPIVLANLYNDLTLLVEKVDTPCLDSKTVSVCGLFRIVQLWVCERFPVFAEDFAKPMCLGDPRVARWDNVKVKLKLPYVRSKLMLAEGFQWRPYADGLKNWEILPFYEDKEQKLDEHKDFPSSELSSYSWFCQSYMLAGYKGKVQYNPHRVARQLGFDQDLPGEISDSNSFIDHVGFLLPSRNFEPGMTKTYSNWWKDSMSCHKEAVRNALKLKMSEQCDERVIMHAPTTADTPMIDLQLLTEKPLKKASLSLGEGEIRKQPGISGKMVAVSHEGLKSNSKENHASVSPHSPSLLTRSTSQNKGDKYDVSSNLKDMPLDSMPCHKEAVSNSLETNRREMSNEKTVAHDCSSDFTPDMQVRPVVDAPVMFGLGTSPNYPLQEVSSSLEEGEIREVCGIPKIIAAISPGVSKCNSKGSHGSVTPQSPSMLKRSTSQFRGDRSDVEHVPLALRLTKMTTKKNKTVFSGPTTHEQSDCHDRDHVPLAFRLQTILKGKVTPKPTESHASTVNIRNPSRHDELTSPTSDAVSWITRKRSSLSQKRFDTNKDKIEDTDGTGNNKATKTKLEDRVTKLEKVVAKLGVLQYGPEFLDSKSIDEE